MSLLILKHALQLVQLRQAQTGNTVSAAVSSPDVNFPFIYTDNPTAPIRRPVDPRLNRPNVAYGIRVIQFNSYVF